MNIEDLQNKKICVLGFGQEGQATAKWLKKHGFAPSILEQKVFSDWDQQAKDIIEQGNFEYEAGESYLDSLQSFDVVFRSPGIWRLNPQLLQAENHGTIITSQTIWFFDHCPAKIIGVTGTKGKGTTASLINKIYSESYTDGTTHLAGNIGLTNPFDILDDLKATDIVVLELSSFQLQDLQKSPQIAVNLMITKDHLDTHKSEIEYREAKQSLVKFQTTNDFAIINADYPHTAELSELTVAKKLWVTTKNETLVGAYIEDTSLVCIGLERVGLKTPPNPFLDTTKVQLRGKHNLENIAAAALAGLAGKLDPIKISESIYDFRGLKHRLEFIKETRGIKFYNDSFATAPEPTLAAIASFTEPIVLILGGSEKHSDFTELAQKLPQTTVRDIILIGETASELKKLIKNSGYAGTFQENAISMPEVFQQIKQVAKAGDVVLLSPACASFGMFKNYKDRGFQFEQSVETF